MDLLAITSHVNEVYANVNVVRDGTLGCGELLYSSTHINPLRGPPLLPFLASTVDIYFLTN